MYLVTVSLLNDLSVRALMEDLDELGIRTIFTSHRKLLGAGNRPCVMLSFVVRDDKQLAPVLLAIRESLDGGQGGFFFVTPVLLAEGGPVAPEEDDALPDPGTALEKGKHYEADDQDHAGRDTPGVWGLGVRRQSPGNDGKAGR